MPCRLSHENLCTSHSAQQRNRARNNSSHFESLISEMLCAHLDKWSGVVRPSLSPSVLVTAVFKLRISLSKNRMIEWRNQAIDVPPPYLGEEQKSIIRNQRGRGQCTPGLSAVVGERQDDSSKTAEEKKTCGALVTSFTVLQSITNR